MIFVICCIPAALIALAFWTRIHLARSARAALAASPTKDAGPRNLDPYRDPGPEPKEHAVDCPGCKWMDRHGRWQPPESMFEACVPIDCIKIKTRMSGEEIAKLAERLGFRRQEHIGT